MYVTTSFHTRMAERPDVRSSVYVPMVYEDVEPKTQAWEYHLLTVDASEVALPDAEQLNVLGKDGWILAGIVDERATGRGVKVYYYFMRQKVA